MTGNQHFNRSSPVSYETGAFLPEGSSPFTHLLLFHRMLLPMELFVGALSHIRVSPLMVLLPQDMEQPDFGQGVQNIGKIGRF